MCGVVWGTPPSEIPLVSTRSPHAAASSLALTVPFPRSLPAPQVPAAHLWRALVELIDGDVHLLGAQVQQVTSAPQGKPSPRARRARRAPHSIR
jgi:hypothetical protein